MKRTFTLIPALLLLPFLANSAGAADSSSVCVSADDPVRAYADADSVISGTVPDGDGIIRKGALIRRIRTEAVRLIRHLGPAPVTLLIFPEAEGTSFL